MAGRSVFVYADVAVSGQTANGGTANRAARQAGANAENGVKAHATHAFTLRTCHFCVGELSGVLCNRVSGGSHIHGGQKKF